MDIENNKESEINQLIEKVNNSYISSIKEVIMQLITVLNDPDSSTIDLKKIIEKDPPLTARLLKLANSAYYGFQRSISEIQEAIVALGFNTVKELALAQKVCELFKQGKDIDGYSRVELWKNSMAVAFCNKFIYMREVRELGENTFTAGLLHNIGIIIEDQFMHEEFTEVLLKVQKDNCNLFEAENSILGFDHADIGRAITYDWDFPYELVLAIGKHHEPDKDFDLLNIITLTSYISDYICQRNAIGYCDAPVENQSFYTMCMNEVKIKEKAMEFIVEDVKKEIRKMEIGGWFNE